MVRAADVLAPAEVMPGTTDMQMAMAAAVAVAPKRRRMPLLTLGFMIPPMLGS